MVIVLTWSTGVSFSFASQSDWDGCPIIGGRRDVARFGLGSFQSNTEMGNAAVDESR